MEGGDIRFYIPVDILILLVLITRGLLCCKGISIPHSFWSAELAVLDLKLETNFGRDVSNFGVISETSYGNMGVENGHKKKRLS